MHCKYIDKIFLNVMARWDESHLPYTFLPLKDILNITIIISKISFLYCDILDNIFSTLILSTLFHCLLLFSIWLFLVKIVIWSLSSLTKITTD